MVEAGTCGEKRQRLEDISEKGNLMDKRQKPSCCSVGEQIESRPWFELPIDILNLISSRLNIIDHIRFRSVCKNWHLVKAPHVERNFPWLLSHFLDVDHKNGGAVTRVGRSFHIPALNQAHIINDTVKLDQEFLGAGVCASKYGWLLLQQSRKAFFYNPFSNKAIKLPDMDITFNRSTFSSIPTSPDCVCFAIESSKISKRILIRTCSPGDLRWRDITLNGFKKTVEDVVYSKGRFYCVFTNGSLGAFCVTDSSWSMLLHVHPENTFNWCRSHLVESNGEILLVSYSGRYRVFKFDWSNKVWMEIHKLGNRALFLGCTSFAIAAEGNTSALAGRIYYHEYARSYFYSLHTRQKHTCEDFYPWVVRGAKEKVWIEAPSV